MKDKKQVFLILCDKTTESLLGLYQSIYTGTKHLGDTYLLYHQKNQHIPEEIQNVNHVTFDDSVLTKLNFTPIGFNLVPGNNHFPLLQFAYHHQNYDYYWVIEEDVRYTGKWETFFDSFSSMHKAFISSHMRTPVEEPAWAWWHTLAHPYNVIPFDQRIRSFNPIYRISNDALRHIYESLTNFWCGHHEVLLPTLLHHAGFAIMDFGGDGPFVLPGHTNKHYLNNSNNSGGSLTDGSMRWRPVFSKAGEVTDKLYHPVKD